MAGYGWRWHRLAPEAIGPAPLLERDRAHQMPRLTIVLYIRSINVSAPR